MKGSKLKINIVEKKKTNNVIIDNKKILIRTNSIPNKAFFFKTFKYEKHDEINFSNLKEKINHDLNNFDYFLVIRIEEDYNEELDELKICYHYYLFPSKYFRIKENFPFLNRTSFSGKMWVFKSYKEFFLKYDLESLISFNICSSYISQ